jgi:nitroreductase
MLKELVQKARSYRRFKEQERISLNDLRDLVKLARLSASSANLQPLRYLLSTGLKTNEEIFPNVAWAGYLKDWDGPKEGERPAGYIIIMGDTRLKKSFGCDHGIAAQNIVLGAAEKGLGACMIGSINREKLRKALSIEDYFDILLVIALGKPAEKVQLETCRDPEDIKYWRDDYDIHHVPKRALADLIIREYES